MGWMRNRCTTDRCSGTLGIGAMTYYYASLLLPSSLYPAGCHGLGVRSHLTLVLNTKNALEMLYSYSIPLISTCAVASKLRTRGELCARRVNVDGSGEIAIATDVGWT